MGKLIWAAIIAGATLLSFLMGAVMFGWTLATDRVPGTVTAVLPDGLRLDGDQSSEVTELRGELTQARERILELEGDLEAAEADAGADSEEARTEQPGASGGPADLYLADMDHVDCEDAGCPSFGLIDGQAEIDGDVFPQSIGFRQRDGLGSVTYSLGRDFARFQALVGISEDSEDGARARVRFYLDDELQEEVEVDLSQTAEIDLDCTGALRLRIESVGLSDEALMTTMIGDGRLFVDP